MSKNISISVRPLANKPVFPGATKKPSAMSVPRSLGNLMPERVLTTLKYTDFLYLDPGAGALASVVYSPSSLYDPYVPSGGHQPLGFDQLAALYAHYVVESCLLRLTVLPSSATANPVATGITLTHDNGVTGTWNKQVEQPDGVTKWCTVQGLSTATQPRFVLTSTYNAKKMTGLSISELMVSDLASAVTTNPVDQNYAVIWAQACDLSADPSTIYYTLEMEFKALFFTKNTLAQS